MYPLGDNLTRLGTKQVFRTEGKCYFVEHPDIPTTMIINVHLQLSNFLPRNTWLFLLTSLFFFSAQPINAQEDVSRAIQHYQDGEMALLKKNYNKAIRSFEKALKIKPDLRAAQRGIGLCHALENRYKLALSQYLNIIEKDPRFSRVLYYQVAEAYYRIGEYTTAIFYFDKFDQLQDVPLVEFTVNGEKEQALEEELLARLPSAIEACQVSQDSSTFQNEVYVYNMGNAINSRFDEYFPFLSNDQRMLFFTKRRGVGDDENLFVSHFENNRWRNTQSVGEPFNTEKNEGMSTMVRDGRKMFFTACNREEVLGPCDIWEARVNVDVVESVSPLSGASNSDKWESQASISCDGRTLYFASNRPGGYGGTDIWYSRLTADGYWSEPINMGPPINTEKDEESPFITNDGKALYFCSIGHLGRGDQDIFMSRKDGVGKWTNPVNLGPKVNTAYRELGFFLSADGRTGYFASDRPGGFGGMDIYVVELTEALTSDPMTFVEGYVRDSLTGKGLPVRVQFAGRESLLTEEDGRFFLCLPANSFLPIGIDETDYRPYDQNYDIPEWDNKSFYPLDILLVPNFLPPPAADTSLREPMEPRKISLTKRYFHTVYFQFDSDDVNYEEIPALQDFADRVQNKDIIRVEINGYADDIGEDQYNLELSERRAKKIALFLMERGIPVSRISMKGYGEIRDDRPNQQNRRVELKVFTKE